MDINFVVAQAFGILGLIAMIISLFQKSRRQMLFFVILNCVFFIFEYTFLGAFAGMGGNIVALGRTVLFREKERNEHLNNIWVYVCVMSAYLVTSFLTFDGFISLLPIIAEYIYTTALWQSEVSRIRYGTAVMVVFWLIYDLIVCAYPSAICDFIVLSSAIVSIVKFWKK
ncbi:YgjV family protein [Candidatus Saccharibacteria bacterium]|nr:YgjV family protein [Candidatus Saccharibacteria bacterium]